MLRNFNAANIPIEILRTVVLIADVGSYSKAGERLGLTQPAVSQQIKRFQILVGGPIFDRSGAGVVLNVKGKLMMPLIRRLLETNDQILEYGGAAKDPRPLRVGISDLYAENFLQTLRADPREVSITCDHSIDLLRGLSDGYIDAGALLRPSSDAGTVVDTWLEPFVWVRSQGFTLSLGAPVPLVGRPGLLSDHMAISLLESRGIAYRFAFSSFDRACRQAAVRAGVGLLLMPAWAIPADLVEAQDYYLPPVPPVEAGIMTRHGIDTRATKSIVEALRHLKGKASP